MVGCVIDWVLMGRRWLYERWNVVIVIGCWKWSVVYFESRYG